MGGNGRRDGAIADAQALTFSASSASPSWATWAAFAQELFTTRSSRWIGPEKGVMHMPSGAVVNAVCTWRQARRPAALDPTLPRRRRKPSWPAVRLSLHQPDALTPAEALHTATGRPGRPGAEARRSGGRVSGYARLRRAGSVRRRQGTACAARRSPRLQLIKLRGGENLEDDIRRLGERQRGLLSAHRSRLAVDATSAGTCSKPSTGVTANRTLPPSGWRSRPARRRPRAAATVARAIEALKVATGEHGQNRVMFKQFLQAKGLYSCSLDAARVGGDERKNVAILLLAAKVRVPVMTARGRSRTVRDGPEPGDVRFRRVPGHKSRTVSSSIVATYTRPSGPGGRRERPLSGAARAGFLRRHAARGRWSTNAYPDAPGLAGGPRGRD